MIVELPGPSLDVRASGSVCAVLQTLSVYCWGAVAPEGLGRGTAEQPPGAIATPAPISADGSFAGVDVAISTACAWRPSGEVLCWGQDWYAQYAPWDGAHPGIPRRVPELEPAKQVAVVEDEVCALGFDQVVRCRVREPDPDKPQTARVLDFENPPPQPN